LFHFTSIVFISPGYISGDFVEQTRTLAPFSAFRPDLSTDTFIYRQAALIMW